MTLGRFPFGIFWTLPDHTTKSGDRVPCFFFFITLGLELSDTKVYEPWIRALLGNCFSLLRSNCSLIVNCTVRRGKSGRWTRFTTRPRRRDVIPGCVIISQNVLIQWFLSSQFTHKIVNLFLTIACYRIKLTFLGERFRVERLRVRRYVWGWGFQSVDQSTVRRPIQFRSSSRRARI